jgi:hypothetical protein
MATEEFITKKKCSSDGCLRGVDSRGLCLLHYKRAVKSGQLTVAKPKIYSENCSVLGCERKSEKRGFCGMHYRRMQRFGTLETIRQAPGGKVSQGGGYLTLRIDGEKKLEHVLIAESALGFTLPPGVEVHHVNENPSDNRPENLVVCQDRQYHMILHARQRALDACGNANWRKCAYCKKYDDPTLMTGRASRGQLVNTFYHKPCAAARAREQKALKA